MLWPCCRDVARRDTRQASAFKLSGASFSASGDPARDGETTVKTLIKTYLNAASAIGATTLAVMLALTTVILFK